MSQQTLSTPGERIRFLRRALGLTQESLALRLHTSQAAVSQWEKDKWLPLRSMQFALAETLNTSRHFLFGEDVDEPQAVGE